MATCHESKPAPEYIIYPLRSFLLPLVMFAHLQLSSPPHLDGEDSYLGLSDG